ncbi:MAG: hypothetical protein AAF447_19765, partial [Myxococcota bacterium]
MSVRCDGDAEACVGAAQGVTVAAVAGVSPSFAEASMRLSSFDARGCGSININFCSKFFHIGLVWFNRYRILRDRKS